MRRLLPVAAALALLAVLATRPLLGAVAALLACHAFARTAAVGVMVSLPYGGDAEHAKAKPLALAVPVGNFAIALAWCGLLAVVLAALGLQAWRLVGAMVAAGFVALLMRRWLQCRLGGYTGDMLGATQQVTECAFLFGLLATARWQSLL